VAFSGAFYTVPMSPLTVAFDNSGTIVSISAELCGLLGHDMVLFEQTYRYLSFQFLTSAKRDVLGSSIRTLHPSDSSVEYELSFVRVFFFFLFSLYLFVTYGLAFA
jgi:hypothetical protein